MTRFGPFRLRTSHVDLNNPRLVAKSSGTPVRRWDQQKPFGVNVPDLSYSGVT